MHITFEIDNEAKALYIRLQEGKIAQTIEYPKMQEMFLDLNEDNQLLGIEILDPSRIDLKTILKDLSNQYGIDDLSSLVNKSLIELAA
ncbi:MAG: hypothetical protein QG641_897 [Candidatus Poribacteria bacterium]|nr:hypothetical protein [Candidatus Poribacteria bacterium]MDQ1327614.1 hypothetical protein [Candidatus Poribacteria bacterium]